MRLGLFCFVCSLSALQEIIGSKLCYTAKICIHNLREKCGVNSKGENRRFYDTCDMKEYNCLHNDDYKKVALEKCRNLPAIEDKKPVDEEETKDPKDFPVTFADNAQDFPVTFAKNAREIPLKGAENARDFPVTRAENARDFPVTRAENARDFPVTRAENARDFPVTRAENARDFPVTRAENAPQPLKYAGNARQDIPMKQAENGLKDFPVTRGLGSINIP